MRTFWNWMYSDFVPKAFTDYSTPPPRVANILTTFGNSYSINWSPRFIGPSRSNVLLGTIRMRELRVKKNLGCEVSKLYQHVFPDCYGKYQESLENKETYNPRFVPTYLKDAYKYETEEKTLQIGLDGKM